MTRRGFIDKPCKCGHRKVGQGKRQNFGIMVEVKDLPRTSRVLVFMQGQTEDEGIVKTRLGR